MPDWGSVRRFDVYRAEDVYQIELEDGERGEVDG